jgi:quercetin dioxygenase-like cupin family protein
MKTKQLITTALVATSALIAQAALAQKEIGRTELTRHDLGDSVHEVIQTRVDFPEGTAFPKHSHPGAEVAYVIEGNMEYQFAGKPPFILKKGDSLFIPAGTVHSAKNVGSGNASELATYVVQKGKPVVVIAAP